MPRSRDPHSGGELGDWGRGPDSGGNAFRGRLDAEVLDLLQEGELAPPTQVSPSVQAQLAYLDKRKGGSEAMDRAGIPRRTRRGWKTRTPSAKSRERINRAYWYLRAVNWRRTGHRPSRVVREALVGQLKERARGRRMTIVPVDSRDVRQQAQGAQSRATERDIRPSKRSWDDLIDAWASGDEIDMDTAWMDFASEIDSPAELYYEVAHVGFVL